MKMHFQIRSVMSTVNSTALTLEQVQWVKDHPTETITDGNETFPAWIECDPTDKDAEPNLLGGKMTELRLEGNADEFRAGEYLTLTVERSGPERP